MNTPNNKRKKDSVNNIEKVFANLIQTKELSEISVTEICKLTNLNRTTFYANFIDVYDLADKFRERMEDEIKEVYKEEIENNNNTNDFLKLFKHIKENQIFYKTYLKLDTDTIPIYQYDINLSKLLYNDEFIDYHIEFFKAGLNAIIKKWLNNNCQETPEEIMHIIESEYKSKYIFNKGTN